MPRDGHITSGSWSGRTDGGRAPIACGRHADLIAFSDFLDDHPKLQAADAGVSLSPKQSDQVVTATAMEHKREEHVLADLKAKSPMLHLRLMEDWMRKRSHRDLFRDH